MRPEKRDRTTPVVEAERVVRRFAGRLAVDQVSLAIAWQEVVCLLGPSGCGKSTTLRMIAGIERPDSGRVCLDGGEMSGPRGFVPPERRSVGLMFQDFALFPHLDIAANVTFGLRGAAVDGRRRTAELLDRVGLAAHARRFPHELSGGEQQRAALARALAPMPRVMLMDEPFSGLDNRLRDGVREATLDILRESGTAVLLVTHDPEEAMRVADRIAFMRGGRVVQAGSPLELYDRPVDLSVAAFFSDVNVISGRVIGASVETPLGRFPARGLADGAPAEVVIRPQHVRLEPGPPALDPDGSPHVTARVERVAFLGRESLIDLRTESGLAIRAAVPGAFLPEVGARLRMAVPRGRAFVFPPASGAAA